jgi:16S rRNA (cytidine1402-2'-O)-methyltransferase
MIRNSLEKHLYNFHIIATPIGNFDDIGRRACKILSESDFVVCEGESEYKKLFGRLNIAPKKFILCNEHDEKEAYDLTLDLLKKGEKGVLISDCGTPLIEDPGYDLVQSLIQNGVKVTSIPGANSIINGIVLSPFKIKDFYFAGFLPRKNDEREKRLAEILKRNETIILMESPYRLKTIISDLKKNSPQRKIYIPFNMTMEDEDLFYGYPEKVEELLEKRNIEKGEFLVFIEGNKIIRNKKNK